MTESELDGISKSFLANVTPFPWATADHLLKSKEGQELLLAKTLQHPEALLYPASGVYRQRILKHWINQANDVLEAVYEMYGLLLSQPLTQQGYKIYNFGGTLIKVEETVAMCSAGTTGLRTWEACIALCEWATEHRELFKDRRVVELGCGTGLLGLTLAQTASCVLLTDYHPDVLQAVQSNITLNCGASDRVSTAELDWCKECDVQADVIVAADVVFDPEILPPLVNTIKRILSSSTYDTPVCYLSSTIRNKVTYQKFIDCLGEEKLVYTVIDSKEEGAAIVEILKITLQS